jgi:hypothetical protein
MEATAVQHRGSRRYAEQLSRTLDAASTPVEHMGIDQMCCNTFDLLCAA